MEDVEHEPTILEVSSELFSLIIAKMVDGMIENLGYVILVSIVGVGGAAWRSWKNREKIRSQKDRRRAEVAELERYCGKFVGYRVGGLPQNIRQFEPKIEITLNDDFEASLYWKTPRHAEKLSFSFERVQGDSFLKITSNQEGNREGYIATFILFTNKRSKVDLLYGVYCFTNSKHRPVAGDIVFLRESIDPSPYLKASKLRHIEIDIDTYGKLLDIEP